MVRFIAFALIIALFSGVPDKSAAEKRVAFIVGNGAYEQAPALGNPANDARLVATSLQGIGFDVVTVLDASRQQLRDAMGEFGRRARAADIALFFYAGHGLEVGGRNWILPIDARIEASSDLPATAVKVDDVLELMELSEARVRLVILDACRNNPLPRSLTRAANRGLARIEASAAGTMIVFSAAPGEVALDGSGKNSPFSTALAAHLGEPGLEVRQMMGRVRADVLAATGDKQVPWVNEAIVGDFYLGGEAAAKPGQTAQPAAPTQQTPQPNGDLSVELAFWNSVQDSGSRQMLELYLRKYPDGAFRELAEVKIAALDNQGSSARSTPPENQQATLQAPVRPDPRVELENQARAFVARFNEAFSASADVALASVADIYAPEVDFHGKRFSLGQIIADKTRFVQRWPARSYRSPENEMSVYCNPAARSCDVRATVYWSVSSAARNKSAQGVSQTDLRIDFAGGAPRVVHESSQTLERN